jgi:RNA polymerase sigma factor (sigma-70 family)
MMNTLDDQTLEDLYQAYRLRLMGSVKKIVHDHHEAEEVVQEVFIKLRRQDMSKILGHEREWLFVVARNTALKVLAKRKRSTALEEHHVDVMIDQSDPRQLCVSKERIEELQTYIQRMTPRQQQLLRNRFVDGMSYQQCADNMKISSGNVGFIQNQVINKLKELMSTGN